MLSAPTVIGGLGGSGTRVFADILRSSGCHIGGNLNGALDYLTFTVLGNRPGAGPPSQEAMLRVGHLLRRETLRPSDVGALLFAAFRPGHHDGRRKRWRYAIGALRDQGPAVGGNWGFKEPNSARVLTELVSAYPDMRYIHVLRHGLDMALSQNINQLRAWGPSMGITWSGESHDLPNAQLNFWLEATRQTHTTGKRLLGERYLLVRYDDMVEDARKTSAQVAEFLRFAGDFDTLIPGISVEGSAGRWKSRADIFSDTDCEAVAAWGFGVER